jgi:hypothetical protein
MATEIAERIRRFLAGRELLSHTRPVRRPEHGGTALAAATTLRVGAHCATDGCDKTPSHWRINLTFVADYLSVEHMCKLARGQPNWPVRLIETWRPRKRNAIW